MSVRVGTLKNITDDGAGICERVRGDWVVSSVQMRLLAPQPTRDISKVRRADAGNIELLSEPGHQSLRNLHAYWLLKKGAAIAPPRTAIDPAEILPLLPNVALLDVIGHPPRFRFRLFGTALAAAYGQDVTGQFLDQID